MIGENDDWRYASLCFIVTILLLSATAWCVWAVVKVAGVEQGINIEQLIPKVSKTQQ
jgi:hypothetical protein